jgi:rubredoxin
MKRIKCPCCGFFTIENDDDIIFDFCDVCGWQYDVAAHNKPDISIGANKISLNEARKNYKLFGASKERLVGTDQIRKPLPEELPENNR